MSCLFNGRLVLYCHLGAQHEEDPHIEGKPQFLLLILPLKSSARISMTS